MPELPEVETVRRQLVREIKGKRIRGVRVLYSKAVRPLSPRAFARVVTGATVRDVKRRAKMLLIELSNGRTLIAHLKMTGKFLIKSSDALPGKFTEIVFDLTPTISPSAEGEKKRGCLFFDDTRRFGWVTALATEDVPELFREAHIGPEPLSPHTAVATWGEALRQHPRRVIKAALLDQTCIAGIGNIYADESLWAAGVRPTRRIGRLTVSDVERLHRVLRTILSRAIRARGSSAISFRDIYDRPGNFVPSLHAYGREGTPCDRKDGGVIKKTVVAGRGTHYCPKHQV